jgi:small subunit ribosomal protein S4
MSRYTEPRVRVLRALGSELPGLSRKKIERRPYPPGQHGQARKKLSEYKLRLVEKQKLRMNYGVTERQMRNLMREALAGHGAPGPKLVELLERRLDNVVFRAGFARTIPAARQLVTHGNVLVGGRRVDIASYRVRVGEVVTLKSAAFENGHVKAALEDSSLERPDWLELGDGRAVVRALPSDGATLFTVDLQRVVEFYSGSV